MTLEVIGAGYGRTGTLSTKVALNLLGFNCYHMVEVLNNKANRKHVDFWMKVAHSTPGSKHPWHRVFANYNATIDNPGACVWRELMEANPEAKVLMTLHPQGADAWYESTMDTIYFPEISWHFKVIGFFSPFAKKMGKMAHHLVWKRNHRGVMENRDAAIRLYHQHLEEVKSIVPPDKLLVFTVDQGWEPLCKFLNVDVPDVAFPMANDRKQIKMLNALMIFGAYLLLALGTTCCGALLWTIDRLI